MSKHLLVSRLSDSNTLFVLAEYDSDDGAIEAYSAACEEQHRSNAEAHERHSSKQELLGVKPEDRTAPELDRRTLLLLTPAA